METEAAHFLIQESAGWQVSPFATAAWDQTSGNLARRLIAEEGSVPDDGTFNPHADLVIAPQGDVPFHLKQFVTPEPSAVALLVGGGLCGFCRRWARRKRNK